MGNIVDFDVYLRRHEKCEVRSSSKGNQDEGTVILFTGVRIEYDDADAQDCSATKITTAKVRDI